MELLNILIRSQLSGCKTAMIGSVCRRDSLICKSSANTSESESYSDSVDDSKPVNFSVTVQDNKTVDEALSLVDDFSDTKFSLNQKCILPEGYCSGEEEEGEDQHFGHSDAKKFKAQRCIHYLKSSDGKRNETERLSPGSTDTGKLSPKAKAKKKRHKALTICTSTCKYEVVRRVARKFGMRDVSENEPWNVYWTDLSVSIERAKDMKRFQKINHFPGMSEICRKDLLARNLNRMLKIFPKDYNFFPKTWSLPADIADMLSYARSRRNRTYICKPESGCQGRGIFITRSLKEVKLFDRAICQIYISKPFLVDGFKFDLRLYVLITSCDPLRVYVYNDGLVRFATCRYREPTPSNTSNVFMHLTNYAVNKYSRTYVVDDEAGSKRKISSLNKWLEKKEYNVEELWQNIDEVIIKTIIAAHPVLKHSYHACFPGHDYTYACFELLGFDILLDYRMKPYILEVNHSPSFHTDAQIDRDIKENLLMDTFNILNLCQMDKRKVMEEDRKRVRERLLQGILHKDQSNDHHNGPSIANKIAKQQAAWEEKHTGNFRRIYPSNDSEKYEQFFNQTQSSVFQDTAASRAREECSRQQREEIELKAKEEAARRPGAKPRDCDHVQPESPIIQDSNKIKVIQPPPKKKHPAPIQIRKSEGKKYILNSFEPGIIDDSEEKDRITNMAQRDFLIRSYGITEQIYKAMMKNGTLRPIDEQKYGLYGKLGYINKMITANARRFPLMTGTQCAKMQSEEKVRSMLLETQTEDDTFLSGSLFHISDAINVHPLAGLKVTCNNVPILNRPQISQNVYAEENGKEGDIRSTKTQAVRCLTNTFRLQELEKREHHQHQ
ncbi:tubulin polyglutamylase ttll6-like [Schistocerca gregaria]|uniref:tubulin polyglutamylase ttll6-like n=1 Tax=Schistocerca gregaria TaxID=7010 RepID=UPI00211E8D18|nr:tubulin polyglutamylase ttll6-like [Schistocerca gregaria]